jgi:beta-lactamase superfamily II metal-dependent hydrolase
MLSVLCLRPRAGGNLTGVLEISFIDVGQGDSIWLHASGNTDILIDGGRRSAGPTVVAHLQAESIDDIDVVVLSHGDADHARGLIDVPQSAIPVEPVIYNGQHRITGTYLNLPPEIQRHGLTPTPAQVGQTCTWDAVEAATLNPQETPTGDRNEDPVVMLVTYDDIDTGEIGDSTEQTIVKSETSIEAEMLKVAHHGSKYSSNSAFLEAVGARVAVIYVGENPHGHPARETLDRLEAIGASVLRTDERGITVLTTDGVTYQVDVHFVVFLLLAVGSLPKTPTGTSTPAQTLSPTSTSPQTGARQPRATGDVVITDDFYDRVQGPRTGRVRRGTQRLHPWDTARRPHIARRHRRSIRNCSSQCCA